MRYYVVTDDGQKFGPADVQTLNQWIAESRLLPTQMLEEEASGARFAARAVPGLNFPVPVTPTQAPGPGPGEAAPGTPGYQGYYRPPGGTTGDDGSRDITPAWVLLGVGFVSCCFQPFVGLVIAAVATFFANKARKKGHRQGGLVFGLCIALLTLAVLIAILSVAMRPMIEEVLRQNGGRR